MLNHLHLHDHVYWKESFELHCTHSLDLPAYPSWKCKIECLYRNNFRKLKKAIKTAEPFRAILLMSLPTKATENLVAKEQRLLYVFAFSLAPKTDAFNKSTVTKCITHTKGELCCLLRLHVWSCDGARLNVEFAADKRQETSCNLLHHHTLTVWQHQDSEWRPSSHSIQAPKALEEVQISSEGVGVPALANLLFGKRQWLSLSCICSSPTGWPELNVFLSLFFQLI